MLDLVEQANADIAGVGCSVAPGAARGTLGWTVVLLATFASWRRRYFTP